MLTIQDKDQVRLIVREETEDMRQEVRRNSILLEDLDHKIAAIAENVSTAGQNNMRINNLDELVTVLEHLKGIPT